MVRLKGDSITTNFPMVNYQDEVKEHEEFKKVSLVVFIIALPTQTVYSVYFHTKSYVLEFMDKFLYNTQN